jgi:adiponectin receptor
MHNQTVNACSHLVGASIFGGLPFIFYHNDYVDHPRSQTEDLLVISFYCFGVAVCFTFSAMQVLSKKATALSHAYISLTSRSFHILADHSHAVSKLWNKLDYIGILILMWAAGVATIFYGFLCDEKLRSIYSVTVRIPSSSTS